MIHCKSVVRNQKYQQRQNKPIEVPREVQYTSFHINNSKQINSRSMTKCYSEKAIKKRNISQLSDVSKFISMKL
jgi:hypothetical protein